MIHAIKIDGDVQEKLNEFTAKLPESQKIVSFNTGGEYLFVHTETNQERQKGRNLLLEEYDLRKAQEKIRG